MPFSTYSTFANVKIRYEDYESYRQAGFNSEFSYLIQAASEFFASSSSSKTENFFFEYAKGLNNDVVRQGTTSQSGYTTSLDEQVDTGPYTFSSTESGGITTETELGAKTIFVPNGGFIIRGGGDATSYSFSQYPNLSLAVGKLGTTNNTLGSGTDSFYIKSTRRTTITDTILSIETTWTDVTTTYSNTRRTYTDISATTEYGTGIVGVGYADDYSGEALIIQPLYGSNWTRDGSSLEYLHIFTSIGTVGPFHTSIIKDNENIEYTFPAERTNFISNIEYQLGEDTEYTVVSSSGTSITYDYLTTVGTTLTFGKSYAFDGTQFYENTDFKTSYSFGKLIKNSTSTSQILNNEVLLDGQVSDSDWKYAFYVTTKAIQAVSSDIFYAIDQNLSYFNSFTYRGTINTTASQRYVLLDAGVFNSSSTSTSASNFTSDSETNIYVSQTTGSGAENSFSESYNSGLYARIFYKNLYSIAIGAQNSAWTKYYTQYSPSFKYVVGGESDSINGYRESLIPENLITKLYFTTYKFERGGAVNAPILVIPIDYTSESSAGTQSFYTYQSVNVPNEFCLGSASASVYWTQSVAGGTTNTTSSFTLAYAGGGGVLTLGEFIQDDFSGGVGEVPYNSGIYHTIGLVNTANGADWSKDGYYYWNSNIRGTSGTTPNAISVVGNGQPITYIASEWVAGRAFPVASIVKSHANSYSY